MVYVVSAYNVDEASGSSKKVVYFDNKALLDPLIFREIMLCEMLTLRAASQTLLILNSAASNKSLVELKCG